MSFPACLFHNPEIFATQGHSWADKRSRGRIHVALDAAISDLIRVIMVTNDPKTSTILNTQLERMSTRFTVVTKALHHQHKASVDWELHKSTVSALEHMAYALEELDRCTESTSPHADPARLAYLALHAREAKTMALEADARGAQIFMTEGAMSGLADMARLIRNTPSSPDALLPLARVFSLARSIPRDSPSDQADATRRSYLIAFSRIESAAHTQRGTAPEEPTDHDVTR